MAVVIHSVDNYKIDFSFFPSIGNIRRFATMGKNVVEMYWPGEKKLAFEVEVCLIEALSNVFFHANNLKQDGSISFQLKKKSNKLQIRVFDKGKGFALSKHFSQKINPYQTNGRGLQLIQEFTDNVKYKRGKSRNELWLEKTVSFPAVEKI
jgi:anti-sigma regulatory factor (Ser/Thr protein kinase)